jgi:Tfp pilus assembly protein PilF
MRSFFSIRPFVPALVLTLAACATLAPEAPVSDNAAVVALVGQAHTDNLEGRLAAAAAGIERALRIEPRNPRLWRELAQLRLAQGEPEQAESLAVRANTLAGSDQRLRAANWRLIAEARSARGDVAGAQEAAERARQLER